MNTALILVISFVGYATGAVLYRRLVSKPGSSAVHPLEMLFVVALLIAIAALRPHHYPARYHFLAGFVMLAIGALAAWGTFIPQGRATAGTREFEDVTHPTEAISLWKRWVNFSHAVVDYEFRLFLVAVYLLIIGPFALLFRLSGSSASPAGNTTWSPRKDVTNLNTARRPF